MSISNQLPLYFNDHNSMVRIFYKNIYLSLKEKQWDSNELIYK